jgi:hypothetical protein
MDISDIFLEIVGLIVDACNRFYISFSRHDDVVIGFSGIKTLKSRTVIDGRDL